MRLDPDELETHHRLRALREGWRHVSTNVARRALNKLNALEAEQNAPSPDAVTAHALSEILNMAIRLGQRLFGKDKDND